MFFKHKYITQPEIAIVVALTIASDNLIKSLQDAPPESKEMQTTANSLVSIFNS